MAVLTAGKFILSVIALFTVAGPYLADWNETHVKNPNWPPHARFHNGQTMTTGLLLGLCSLYFLWRPVPPGAAGSYMERSSVNLALLFIHLYYIPSMSGSLYPGALWMDPEFGEGKPQAYAFSVLLGLSWTGWFLEKRRLTNTNRKET